MCVCVRVMVKEMVVALTQDRVTVVTDSKMRQKVIYDEDISNLSLFYGLTFSETTWSGIGKIKSCNTRLIVPESL